MTAPRIFIADIVAHASEVFDVAITDIKGHRRLRYLVRPRMAVAYLAKQMTPLSFPRIGAALGGRDHSTIIHACREVPNFMARDAVYSAQVASLRARVLSEPGRAHAIEVERAQAIKQARAQAQRENDMAEAKRVRALSRQARATERRDAKVLAWGGNTARPRNDFMAENDTDDAHEFHADIGKGSVRLLAGLRAAGGGL